MSTTDPSPTVRWHMTAELRGRLLGPAGLPLAEWLRNGSATVVKDGAHRAVYRVRLPGLDCHVKHNRLYGWRSRVRELFRPSKGGREFALAAALHAKGIPAPRPLAWGTEATVVRPGASWLVSETVADGQTLLAYLETVLPTLAPAAQVRRRLQLGRSVGAFLARLHAAGVVHHDLHPGNLLVRFDDTDEPLLWLLDLHAVSVGHTCSWATRRRNLSVFNRYFVLRAGRADRLRFWRAYQAIAAGAVSVPPALAARQVERLTERSNSRFWQARDARSLRSNRYYTTIRSDSLCGHVVRDFDRGALAPLLEDPDAPFRRADVRVLKDSPSSTVVDFTIGTAGGRRRVAYKRFRVRDQRDPWLSLVRLSAAIRSWVFGQGLRERHLPTPRPLAVWHRRRRGIPHEGYLLTEHLDHALDLHGFVRRAASLGSVVGPSQLRRRADTLARMLRDLHQRGISHRDLKASNLLTGADANDHRVWFIDLVGVRRHRRLGRPRKVQNLARLNASFLRHPLVTRTARLRFLWTYINAALHGTTGWKDWWRAVAAATEAKRDKNKKNGRPLD